MLNQTLTHQTLSKIIRLKQGNKDAIDSVTELLKLELEQVVAQLLAEETPSAMYRCQGSAEKLKELIQLFETPTGFKQLFQE
jgi:hypothetical protein